MKTKIFLITLYLMISAVSFSQPTPSLILFDTAFTNSNASKSFYLKNIYEKTISVNNIRTLTSNFSFLNTPFVLNPNDSILITVNFKSNQNVTHYDFLILENSGIRFPLIYQLIATAKYPDALYSFTQNLYDEALKTALRTFTTTGYISLGYNTARDKMFETVDDYGGDTIECVYTGIKIYAVNRTQAQNQGFNTEHTYPQSFFNENEPMRSDLYHLYPTENNANNVRSNYAFGNVVSNITWTQGGSKLGQDYENQIVFEPRNVHKGNVARSLFYFTVKYSNLGGFMSGKQETALRQWNLLDTVDARERLRNDRIQSFQNVRNPFIDHPELIDRIKSTFSTIPNIARPKISASPFSIKYDTLAANDTASYYLAVFNYGTGNLNISSVTSSIPQFTVENYPSVLQEKSSGYIKIKFRPSETNQTYNGVLNIQNSDSAITVNLTGFSNSSVGISRISDKLPDNYRLYQNYPNPFNPSTYILFDLPENVFAELKIFDLAGREISNILQHNLNAGSYSVNWNASSVPSGIYIYRLKAGKFTETRKMILIK